MTRVRLRCDGYGSCIHSCLRKLFLPGRETEQRKFGMEEESVTVPAERRESCRAERRDDSDGWRGRRGGQQIPFCSPFALSLSPLCSLRPSARIDSVFWATVLTGKAVLFYGCSRAFGWHTAVQPGSRDPRTACSIRRVGRGQTQPVPSQTFKKETVTSF